MLDCAFPSHTVSLCLFITVFKPFTFKVIIDTLELKCVILLYVLGLFVLLILFFVSFCLPLGYLSVFAMSTVFLSVGLCIVFIVCALGAAICILFITHGVLV